MTAGLPSDDGLTVREQPFEAAFLGGPVWRMQCAAPATEEKIAALLGTARRRSVRLVLCRLPEGSPMAGPLQRAGFRPLESLVTYKFDLAERDLGAGFPVPPFPGPPAPANLALPDDRAGCVAIASRAFSFDRFHRDRDRLGDVGDRIKAAWVDNAFAGRADAILVTRHGDRPTGFVLCQRSGDAAFIDLIAVDPAFRGKGLGRILVRGVLEHYAGSAPLVRVGTQDDNTASNRLYQSIGFQPVDRQTTFHWTPDSLPCAP